MRAELEQVRKGESCMTPPDVEADAALAKRMGTIVYS
jgi:hypothetical protein